MYNDGYDTDDTDELLASKCSFQPVVVVCNGAKQKASGSAAIQRESAAPCTIVEDEDWLFSIAASSTRPVSGGTQPNRRRQQEHSMYISKQEAQARVELSHDVPERKESDLPTSGNDEDGQRCRSFPLDSPGVVTPATGPDSGA